MNINMPSNEQIRKQIERLYCGTMTVITREAVKDPETKQTEFKEVVKYSDIPCRISHKSADTVNITDGAPEIAKTVTLIYPPEIEISEGSKITVTQHGETREYMRSGPPAVYRHHAETAIELFERWA